MVGWSMQRVHGVILVFVSYFIFGICVAGEDLYRSWKRSHMVTQACIPSSIRYLMAPSFI
jgi:succinate dehydrogenase hydrophobic anchor subunit